MNLKLNEKQAEYMFQLLDMDLRQNGLNVLMRVVDLQNALLDAQRSVDVYNPETNDSES